VWTYKKQSLLDELLLHKLLVICRRELVQTARVPLKGRKMDGRSAREYALAGILGRIR
jgi:hypothetical protein